MKNLVLKNSSYEYLEGRALIKCPVDIFSEGASLQGGSER